MKFIENHLLESINILKQVDVHAINKMVNILSEIRNAKGRLFFLGVGGSAANCSHAVNDFRKIVGIESYTPTDNVSELTARTNDEGWSSVFVEWLKVSRLGVNDCIFVMSVGGGSRDMNISPNIVNALTYAKTIGSKVIGIVGKDGGYTATVADACVIIPTVNKDAITPHTEAFQGIIWHLITSHPRLKAFQTKWESTDEKEKSYIPG